jgi:hypothetical protein|tara:strand:- start:194 stop:415 length:222 start_codon:yes stop_codon:yes gene_type:complete
MKILKLTLLIYLSIFSYAFSYFDPGTGSMIIQAIIAVFSTVVIYLTAPFAYIKKKFKALFQRKTSKNDEQKDR